jgi:hypothetical protein
MVLIPVAIGVFYVFAAAGAIRDWRPLVWAACLLSIGVAVLSTTAIVASDFSVLKIDSEMGDPPMVAVSPNGGTVLLDSIPGAVTAEMRRMHASAVKRQKITVALLLLVSIGSSAVVVMHGFAWRWLIHGKATLVR